jgi:hypothetical protein
MESINNVVLPIFRKKDHFKKNDRIFFLFNEKIEVGVIEDFFENSYYSVRLGNNKKFAFFKITPFILLEKEFFLLMEKKEYWEEWWNKFYPDFSIKYEDNILGFLNLNIENELKI